MGFTGTTVQHCKDLLEQLQEALKLSDAAFFKATFALLDAAEREGADNYYKVFGEDNDDGEL